MLLADSNPRFFARADRLSRIQVKGMIGPLDVIRILNREKISFVLVGAYGLVCWTKRPRATEDVDVVVALRQVKKAVRVLQAAFPNLDAEDLEVVVRLKNRETGRVVIDVMKPIQPPYSAAFKHTTPAEEEGVKYRVPNLEMAIASKFAPLVSLHRADELKSQDFTDFLFLVKANDDIDMELLNELGESIFPGGGKELVEKVRGVKSGQKLVF